MQNTSKITLVVAVLTVINCSVAFCQLSNVELKSKTAKKLKSSLEIEIDDLKSQYDERLAELNSQFENKAEAVRKAAVADIETGKTEATKAGELDDALELRSLATTITKIPTKSLFSAATEPERLSDSLSNETWAGNIANKKDKLKIVITGAKKKFADWNGQGRVPIERVGNRYWIRVLGDGYAELIQHQDMLIVLAWDGKFKDPPPTRHPSRLGILYR